MSFTQKVILVALLAVGALCLIVGLSLMHYIGGFLRTVEEEAQEQESAPGKPPASGSEKAPEEENGEKQDR